MPNKQQITSHQCPVRKCPWGAPITDHLSDEIKFLIACCQTKPSDDDKKFILSYPSTINQQQLTSMASSHGILPLVYKTLKNVLEDNSSLTNPDL